MFSSESIFIIYEISEKEPFAAQIENLPGHVNILFLHYQMFKM